MSLTQLPDSLHSEAGVAEPVLATLEKVQPRKLAMLDGGEIIELSLKPSLWYIPIVCGRYATLSVVLALVLAVFVPPADSSGSALLVIACLGTAMGLISVAALQWASRLYVLTNRRVLRFKGVSTVELLERPLAGLDCVEVHASPLQRFLRLGSIRLIGRDGQAAPLTWEHLARPDEVRQKLNEAIHRARNGNRH
jgi:hypothetical protein